MEIRKTHLKEWSIHKTYEQFMNEPKGTWKRGLILPLAEASKLPGIVSSFSALQKTPRSPSYNQTGENPVPCSWNSKFEMPFNKTSGRNSKRTHPWQQTIQQPSWKKFLRHDDYDWSESNTPTDQRSLSLTHTPPTASNHKFKKHIPQRTTWTTSLPVLINFSAENRYMQAWK